MVGDAMAVPVERNEELLSYVGQRLQDTRNARGLTQQVFAERLGVEESTLSRYEIGDRPISLSLLAKAADLLGVHLTSFLPLAEEAEPASGFPHDAERVLQLFQLLDEHHRDLAIRLLGELAQVPQRNS